MRLVIILIFFQFLCILIIEVKRLLMLYALLRNGGGIGCRDFVTLNYLRENKIDSYYSGCLTTTLTRKFLGVGDNVERKGVIFVDCPGSPRLKIFPVNRIFSQIKMFAPRRRLWETVVEVMRDYGGENIEYITHEYPKESIPSQEARFSLAKNLLRKYSMARLVITSRIHCALPCLALGTPVVLVVSKYDKLRYDGITNLLNFVYIDDNAKIVKKIDTASGGVVNSDEFLLYANSLRKRCEEFCEK